VFAYDPERGQFALITEVNPVPVLAANRIAALQVI
jgi:hypothetical protein